MPFDATRRNTAPLTTAAASATEQDATAAQRPRLCRAEPEVTGHVPLTSAASGAVAENNARLRDVVRRAGRAVKVGAGHLRRLCPPRVTEPSAHAVPGRPTAPPALPASAKIFVLTPAAGPTMAQRAQAAAQQARQQASEAANAGARSAFDLDTIALLFHRDAPKTELLADLVAAPIERALEAIMVDETVRHMPARLRRPLEMLARAAATCLQEQTNVRREAWTQKTIALLQTEYPRPWSSKTPITGALCEGQGTTQEKASALIHFLRQPLMDGFAALACMTLTRSLYMAAEGIGISASTLPFVSRAAGFYVGELLEQTGRASTGQAGPPPRHQGVGLTALGAPSPVDSGWMQPAVLACHRYRPDETNPHVLEALAYGNPYGVGISGTTNLFLFAAAAHAPTDGEALDAVALTASLAAMLCYDGGHSLHEVFAGAKAFPAAQALELRGLRSYHPGHARGTYIDVVDPEGSWLQQASLARLAAFLLRADHAG